MFAFFYGGRKEGGGPEEEGGVRRGGGGAGARHSRRDDRAPRVESRDGEVMKVATDKHNVALRRVVDEREEVLDRTSKRGAR